MKITVFRLLFILAAILPVKNATGQYTFFTPEGSFGVEVSLQNTSLKRLPIYRNAITSLSCVGDYIVGGTSAEAGLSPFIFVASLKQRSMIDYVDLNNVIKDQKAIRTGFCKTKDGRLLAGTMPQNSSEGHIILVQVDAKSNIKIEDLGVPVAKEGVFALTMSRDEKKLFGLSFPSGKFFSYDLNTRKFKVFDEIAPSRVTAFSLADEYSLTPENYLSKDLIADDNGVVYGSLPFGKIFAFSSKEERFTILKEELPEVWGRKALSQLERWVRVSDEIIYGSNHADGQIFELNTKTKKIKNLGKPAMMPGISGMTIGADKKLYGLSGGNPAYSHLFSYDKTDGFVDYGNPQFNMVAPGVEKSISWRGFQLSSITSSDDGTYIVMGENESLSQLLVFPVIKK